MVFKVNVYFIKALQWTVHWMGRNLVNTEVAKRFLFNAQQNKTRGILDKFESS